MKTIFMIISFSFLLLACEKTEPRKNYICNCTTTADITNYAPSASNHTIYGTKNEAATECAKYNKTEKSTWFSNSWGQPATFNTTCKLQ